jgi:TatD DNase family protein
MSFAAADAHIHLADLLGRDPDFPERISVDILSGKSRIAVPKRESDSHAVYWSRWVCCAASHDESEWEKVEALRSRLPPFVSSFGIHPQWAVWKNADFLARLAAEGKIAAIGEAGFDYYGDRPERVRNAENEGAQRAIFDFQIELAERSGLPLLLHLRKAMDMAFAYAPRLRRLRAAIFHSYSGTPREAESLLAKGVNAYFSFGAPILNGNKRACAACASIPADRLLAETDAPWQPPRGGEFCRAEDLATIVEGIARMRDVGSERLGEAIEKNFRSAYGI